MGKKRIVVVAGTRPEVIKMAPIYFALRDSSDLEPLWLSTAQHREMLDQALAVFGIEPHRDLNLMQPGQTLGDLTARVVTAVGGFLESEKPDAVLVQGDTTTVLGSSLAAFYAGIPIGHVEAGLRTGNMLSPWPEEMNRRLTDPLCQWCFAPTERSKANLLAEQIPAERVHVTGNSVIDALLWVRAKLEREGVDASVIAERCGVPAGFVERFLVEGPKRPASTGKWSEPESAVAAKSAGGDGGVWNTGWQGRAGADADESLEESPRSEGGGAGFGEGSSERRWILVTGHRRESFGGGFEQICEAIRDLVDRHPDVGVLYPVHLNPNVQEPVRRILGEREEIALIEPVAYEEFIWLMDRCHFVLSDSGGVQEEAPSLGKPVLVMRETTERQEGVEAGTCRLVGTDPAKILAEAEILLQDEAAYRGRCRIQNPFGDGTAGTRVREVLEASF